MSVSDILSGVGQGLAKAGAVAAPLLERTAQVVSGEAPQIDAEQRKKQESLEDATIETQANELQQQLDMGRKYGTLTPDQQQQYVDQITGLYSHPRHAGKLMEKLRQAIHPNGAYAQGPSAPLPNATPAGGTAAADTRAAQDRKQAKPLTGVKPFKGSDGKYYQPVETGAGTIENMEVPDYTPPPVKSGGKSPPVTGDRLPSDAAGPDGKPIPDAERNAGKSYVEFHGAFYPVAPPKPVFKTLRGHSVLVDPQSGNPIRDLGPVGAAKVTTRQTLQPGDDGQMHLVTLTSVTTPEGATIDVEPQQEGGTTESQSGTEGKQPQPKTGAKAVSPGSILPKTGAKSAPTPSGGKVVPGLTNLAKSKDPLYRADVASYKKVKDDAEATNEAFQSAQSAIKSPSPSSDQELIYSWVRSNVQGAGRMTQAEFRQAASVGSLPQRAQNWYSMASSGKMTPEIRQMMFADIKRSSETKTAEANRLRNALGGQDAPPPSGSERKVGDVKKFPNGKTGVWDGQGWVAQ